MSRFSWRQETNDRSDTGRSKLKFVICGFSLPMTNGNAFPILPYSVLEQTLGSRRSKLGFCRQVPVLQMRELSLRIYCSATYSSFNPAKLFYSIFSVMAIGNQFLSFQVAVLVLAHSNRDDRLG